MSGENEMLKLLLAVVNHHDGVLELNASDLRAPSMGEGVLIERKQDGITLRRITKSSEMIYLGASTHEKVESVRSPSETDNIPFLNDDVSLAQAEEAFKTRHRRQ